MSIYTAYVSVKESPEEGLKCQYRKYNYTHTQKHLDNCNITTNTIKHNEAYSKSVRLFPNKINKSSSVNYKL